MGGSDPEQQSLHRPTALVLLACTACALGTVPAGTYAPLIPELKAQWNLSNARAGSIESAFQIGYVIASPFLLLLSDRFDAKRIFVAAALLSTLSCCLLAYLADGWLSALYLRALSGVGMAGIYLPGLKLLVDRMPEHARPKVVAYYTASYAIGMSLGVLLSGQAMVWFGWRGAFIVAGSATLLAAALVMTVAGVTISEVPKPWRQLFDIRPALQNRRALSFTLAYAAHMWELYAFRAWLVVFLVHVAALRGESISHSHIATVASLVLLLGLPASIAGNELAVRLNARRVLSVIMIVSAALACLVPHATASFTAAVLVCCIYSIFVSADSGALTGGAVQFADPARRGATLAVHSVLGFSSAAVAPLVFGFLLDQGGGQGWAWAFGSLTLGVLMGPLALRLVWPRDEPQVQAHNS